MEVGIIYIAVVCEFIVMLTKFLYGIFRLEQVNSALEIFILKVV